MATTLPIKAPSYQKYCFACRRTVEIEHKRIASVASNAKRHAALPIVICKKCGAEMTRKMGRNPTRCGPCRKRIDREFKNERYATDSVYREEAKLKAREQRVPAPKERPCIECGNTVHRTRTSWPKRCPECAREHRRELERERRADPESLSRQNQKQNARRNHRRATDQEYRERENERQKEAYRRHPEYRERTKRQAVERYHSDPAYRARTKEKRNRWEREKCASDPDYRLKRHCRTADRKAMEPVPAGTFYRLFERQCAKCANPYCQVNIGRDDAPFHLDHITPVSKGGKNVPTNLQLLCARCNLEKGSVGWEAFLDKYLKRYGMVSVFL